MDFLRIRQKARERARDREQSGGSAAATGLPEPAAPAEPVPGPALAPDLIPPSAVAASTPANVAVEVAADPLEHIPVGGAAGPPAATTLPALAAAPEAARLSVELAQLEEALVAELDGMGSAARVERPAEERPPDPLDDFFWREDETAPRLPDLVAASELPMPEPPPVRREWLTFRLGAEEYGLQIEHVREVLKPPPLTEVPRAPAHILGVIMVRGEIIAVLDPRGRLGLPRAQLGPRSRVLVCDAGGVSCGVLVDAVSSVIRLAPSDVEPRPAGIGAESAEYIAGIGRERNRLYVLLDAPALLGDALAARPAGGLA